MGPVAYGMALAWRKVLWLAYEFIFDAIDLISIVRSKLGLKYREYGKIFKLKSFTQPLVLCKYKYNIGRFMRNKYSMVTLDHGI